MSKSPKQLTVLQIKSQFSKKNRKMKLSSGEISLVHFLQWSVCLLCAVSDCSLSVGTTSCWPWGDCTQTCGSNSSKPQSQRSLQMNNRRSHSRVAEADGADDEVNQENGKRAPEFSSDTGHQTAQK